MIIVPTKYYKVPTDHFKDLGVSLIIWANHNLRASIAAIQQTTKQIYTDQSLVNVEEKVGLKRRGKGKGGLFQKKSVRIRHQNDYIIIAASVGLGGFSSWFCIICLYCHTLNNRDYYVLTKIGSLTCSKLLANSLYPCEVKPNLVLSLHDGILSINVTLLT